MTDRLPRFVSDLLGACPTAGAGVHNWLFRCARVLHRFYPDRLELANLLGAAAAGCGRQIPEREILQAVDNSRKCAWQPKQRDSFTQPKRTPKWPQADQERIEAITKDGPGLVDLWEMSPLRLEDNESHAEEIIDALFPNNPLLCVGSSNSDFDTKPRAEWKGELARAELIVPSPMSGLIGLTQEGNVSAHSLNNTGPRRFLVIEFDEGPVDRHAALLWRLKKIGPLVLAVFSGNKSLHGWFHCQGEPEDKLHGFMKLAVSLGADKATWTRSQFVRLPEGTRKDGRRQRAFYYDPILIAYADKRTQNS